MKSDIIKAVVVCQRDLRDYLMQSKAIRKVVDTPFACPMESGDDTVTFVVLAHRGAIKHIASCMSILKTKELDAWEVASLTREVGPYCIALPQYRIAAQATKWLRDIEHRRGVDPRKPVNLEKARRITERMDTFGIGRSILVGAYIHAKRALPPTELGTPPADFYDLPF